MLARDIIQLIAHFLPLVSTVVAASSLYRRFDCASVFLHHGVHVHTYFVVDLTFVKQLTFAFRLRHGLKGSPTLSVRENSPDWTNHEIAGP